MYSRFKMRIGLDLDEVLCGLWMRIDQHLREEHDLWLNFERDMVSYKIEKLPWVSNSIARDVYSHIEDGSFFKEAPPTAYAEHAVNKLRIAGAQIFIVTHRHEEHREYTEKWLDDNNINFDVLCMEGNKAEVINKFDIEAMVDDRHDVLSEIYRKCGPLKYGLYCLDVPWSYRFHSINVLKVADVSVAANQIVTLKGNAYENEMPEV